MFDAIAKPFGMLLMWLYEGCMNYGLAVILFALIVKLIMLPFQMKSKKGMMRSARLQPRLKELEKKHGANKQKYQAEVAKMYKEEGVNPASGCLWSLIPFPILIALYRAIVAPMTIMMGVAAEHLAEGGAIFTKLASLNFSTTVGKAYEQISQTQFISQNWDQFSSLTANIPLKQINYGFLGMDLGAVPQWNFLWTTDWSDSSIWLPGLLLFLLPFISGALSFFSAKIAAKSNPVPDGQQGSMNMMNMIMPLFSIYLAFIMPAALGIYWAAGSVFAIIQDIVLTNTYTKKIDAEFAEKEELRTIRDAEIERKRLETEKKRAENATEVNPSTSKRKQQRAEKQEQLEKAVDWERQNSDYVPEVNPSRIGDRKNARGRAYDPDRYSDNVSADTSSDDEVELVDVADAEIHDATDVADIPVEVLNDDDMPQNDGE